VFFGFAHLLDLNEDYILVGFLFCCAQLWSLVSAPTGIVRALNRFEMAVYVEAVVPMGRLVGALIVWMTGPSVERFLLVWALVDLLESVCYWAMARWLCPEAVRLSYLKDFRQAAAENEGLRHFFLVTYASSTLNALSKNGPLLIVGALVGTRAAGLYRLASQLSQALSKFSTMLTRAVYAEISRVRVASSMAEFRRLAVQTSMIAGGGGILVVVVAGLFGRSRRDPGPAGIGRQLRPGERRLRAGAALDRTRKAVPHRAADRAGRAGGGHGAVHPHRPERRGLGGRARSGGALRHHGDHGLRHVAPD
jgi:O-antigen/teichoic acid export membrane protein